MICFEVRWYALILRDDRWISLISPAPGILLDFGAGVGPRILATPDLTRHRPTLPASVPTRRQRSCKLHEERRSGLLLNFAGFPLAFLVATELGL